MTDRPVNSCDIALIGGGLTTCMMAAVLGHCGYSVIWFSGTATDKPEKKDNRTTTLHHAGMKMLEALGVWPALAKDAWPLCDIFVKILHFSVVFQKKYPKSQILSKIFKKSIFPRRPQIFPKTKFFK